MCLDLSQPYWLALYQWAAEKVGLRRVWYYSPAPPSPPPRPQTPLPPPPQTTATHANLVYDVIQTDCQGKNGSTNGCAFRDFQISICNKQDEKSRVKLLYVDFLFYVKFPSIRPVMFVFFATFKSRSVINRTRSLV